MIKRAKENIFTAFALKRDETRDVTPVNRRKSKNDGGEPIYTSQVYLYICIIDCSSHLSFTIFELLVISYV